MRQNKLLNYLKNIRKAAGAHPAYDCIMELTWQAELAGEKSLAHESFKSVRERAEILIPWLKGHTLYEGVLDLLECAFLEHRIKAHGETWLQKRKDELYTALAAGERKMVDMVKAPSAAIKTLLRVPGINLFVRRLPSVRFWMG